MSGSLAVTVVTAAILGDADGGRLAAAVGSITGASLTVGHRDRDRLGVGELAVGDLDDHVVDVVAAESSGASKSGALTKLSAPVQLSIVNRHDRRRR